MRYRRSLRFRIILSYLAVGGLIAPLLAGFLFFTIHELEEQLIGRHVAEELRQFMDMTRQNPKLRELNFKSMKAFVHSPGEPPGAGMAFTADLSPGVHEIKHNGAEYYAAVADRDGQRYTFIYDVTEFENREASLIILLIGGTLFSLYGAIWFGYWLSGRLIAPVTSLAQQVTVLGPEPPVRPIAEDYASDEVGELARAFDAYNRRLHAFVQRERDFTADASHELRNPLAVIQSAAELLLARTDLPEAARMQLQRIERAACNMNQNVTALLVLAREPESGALREKTDVAAVVDETLKTESPLLVRPGVRVEPVLAAHPQVSAPPGVVAVLVGNLIRNALAYTQRGHIAIRLDRRRLVIEDTGIGIQEQHLERVFERGFRGEGVPGAGSGLGLSIARRICERYGWTLQLDSRSGHGTRVEWTFDAG